MTMIGKGRVEPAQLTPNVPQFLFDDEWIAEFRRVSRSWIPASVFPNPVLHADKPWEGTILNLFGTVFEHPVDGLRMYYSNLINATQDVLLATSKDGIRWEKPDLGQVSWNDSKHNNIVLTPRLKMDSPSLVYDPDDQEYPYKMTTFEQGRNGLGWGENEQFGIHTYHSKDGLRWDKRSTGPVLRAGDRTIVQALKQDGKYVAYTRHLDMTKNYGKRCIFRSESTDFQEWSEPELVLTPDLMDPADAEFYGLTVFERHGWQLGMLEYWHGDQDCLEIHLVFSRDGKRWSRANPRAAFIAPKYEWNRKWNTCASNGPVLIGSRMVFYVGARYAAHNRPLVDTFGTIGYATLPIDQFCAIEAKSEGQFTTIPMEWPGGELILNADTRESYHSSPGKQNGEIRIDVLDEQGEPVEGWSGEHCGVFCGNTHGAKVIASGLVGWGEGRLLDQWKGKGIRLRFRMRHARLFTFEAGAAKQVE
ncbi:hypothetical protein [Paenibacillus koleovorans]|uniref:hypothetical protein n=1 Tax=Paenibacillus koleovorans TaxID=121608 RepID=UPI000FD89D5B|nr:hypothetical protein [Paenibacillus koleovorans]